MLYAAAIIPNKGVFMSSVMNTDFTSVMKQI